MEGLETSAERESPAAQPWYEGVSLEDAEIYIQANLKSAARSVIAIGYYLKCVNKNELFKEAGYKDICEYAKDRFGFSASTTSRYMTRNDKFSVNGNSPILDEKYKDFNKSQLQEMLSLDAEQLEKVTPDMTVVQIREMKKPKEIPYIPIPGQVELTDFPGVEPEDVAAASNAREEMGASSTEKKSYTISAEELLPEPRKKTIAISQSEQLEQTGKCIHRPDFYCSLNEAYKLVAGNGDNCSRSCCWDCTKKGNCRLECYSSERRPVEADAETQQDPEVTVESQRESQVALEAEKLQDPDEDWNIGDLPQAKEQYLKQLARILVQECGYELRMTPGELGRPSDDTIRRQTNALRLMHSGMIELDDGVNVFPSEDMIEFFMDGEDLGVCSHARFATQVRKALEEEDQKRRKSTIEDAVDKISRPAEPELEVEKDVVGKTEKSQELEKYQVSTYDKFILNELINSEEAYLKSMGEIWMKTQPNFYTKHIMMLDAYRMLWTAHEGGML